MSFSPGPGCLAWCSDVLLVILSLLLLVDPAQAPQEGPATAMFGLEFSSCFETDMANIGHPMNNPKSGRSFLKNCQNPKNR